MNITKIQLMTCLNRIFFFFSICSTCFFSYGQKGSTVWYEGKKIFILSTKKTNSYAYFKNWNDWKNSYIGENRFRIILQLDKSLLPFEPKKINHLPNLEVLSAINNPNLIKAYFYFLEDSCKAIGISKLVLPDTAKLNILEKEILKTIVSTNPHFFIPYNNVSFQYTKFKRRNTPVFSVFDRTKKIRKSFWRREKHILKNFKSYYASFHTDTSSFQSKKLDHKKILKNLLNHSVILLDPHNMLPLKSQKIDYIGNDTILGTWISKQLRWKDNQDTSRFEITIDTDTTVFSTPIKCIVVSKKGNKNNQPQTAKLLLPYSSFKNFQPSISKMLFGSLDIQGVLISNQETSKSPKGFLGYSTLKEEHMNPNLVEKIDALIDSTIIENASPGCQIMILKNNQVVYEKNFGYHTYDSMVCVTKNTVYDLASLSKVLATLPVIALLIDRKIISLDDPIAKYIPELVITDKFKMTIKEILAHNSQLYSYIPFWKNNWDGKKETKGSLVVPQDSLIYWIGQSKLHQKDSPYMYSDLGFILLKILIERVTKTSLNKFLKKTLYNPANIALTFNPVTHGFSKETIAPTEIDDYFREDTIHGIVHDQNAYIMGGISGHSGLFGSAKEVAKMMCLYGNFGFYENIPFLSDSCLSLLNQRHFPDNRRGLGWDKTGKGNMIVSQKTSHQSYGHTGFTGSMIWQDPKYQLCIIFLTNRTYPNAENKKLLKMNVRTRLHDMIYESLMIK